MSPIRSPLCLALAACLCFPIAAHAARGLEGRDLASMDRFSAPTLSPDGRVLVAGGRLAGLFDTATALLSKPSHCKPVQPPRWKWEWPAVTVYPWKTWPAACIPKISCK